MKKVRGGKRGQLGQFEMVDVNDVCYTSDEELYGCLHDLIEVREEGIKVGADTAAVEIEICYVQRELRIRKARRNMHEEYVRELQNENAVLEQAVVMATPTEAN